MRIYYVGGPTNAAASSNATMVAVIGSTTARPHVREFSVSSADTPTDQAAKYALTRFTAAGTAGSSPTPAARDSADVASVCTAGISHSAEPTYTTTVWSDALHQRARLRYECAPGYEFVGPATASTGFGLQLVTATAAFIPFGTIHFFE